MKRIRNGCVGAMTSVYPADATNHPLPVFPREGERRFLQFPKGLRFDDALEGVGLGGSKAVEAFECDEDFVRTGAGEAQVAEGHAGDGIGDCARLLVVGHGL